MAVQDSKIDTYKLDEDELRFARNLIDGWSPSSVPVKARRWSVTTTKRGRATTSTWGPMRRKCPSASCRWRRRCVASWWKSTH